MTKATARNRKCDFKFDEMIVYFIEALCGMMTWGQVRNFSLFPLFPQLGQVKCFSRSICPTFYLSVYLFLKCCEGKRHLLGDDINYISYYSMF